MDLKTFIKQSLLDIAGAIEEANADTNTSLVVNPVKLIGIGQNTITVEVGDHKYPMLQKIKFDVAVTVGLSSSGSTDTNINVAGSIIGETGETSDEHLTASRIQFEIPVLLPYSE